MSDRNSSPAPAPVPEPQQKPEPMNAELPPKEESPNTPSPTASVAQKSQGPSSSPGRRPWRSLAQRRAALRDDPLVGEVEPHRIYCRACQKWIKLSNIQYGLTNWRSHKQRCPGTPTSLRSLRRTPSKPNFTPDSRVATTERHIILLNDPQVKSFSAGHVDCNVCKTTVELEGEVDYDLTRWTEHKKKCIPKAPAPITPQGPRPHTFPPPSTSSPHSQVSTGGPARSPTPAGEGSGSQSTETTAVPGSSPPTVKIGVKRGRSKETGDEEDAAKDERPTVRPRTETYRRLEKDAPSLFGWLAQPLKEFARGFREGLDST